jgi:hypothetical protein
LWRSLGLSGCSFRPAWVGISGSIFSDGGYGSSGHRSSDPGGPRLIRIPPVDREHEIRSRVKPSSPRDRNTAAGFEGASRLEPNSGGGRPELEFRNLVHHSPLCITNSFRKGHAFTALSSPRLRLVLPSARSRPHRPASPAALPVPSLSKYVRRVEVLRPRRSPPRGSVPTARILAAAPAVGSTLSHFCIGRRRVMSPKVLRYMISVTEVNGWVRPRFRGFLHLT